MDIKNKICAIYALNNNILNEFNEIDVRYKENIYY